MATAEQFELRAGNNVRVILSVHSDGSKTLEHSLTELDVVTCSGLAAYDNTGQLLTIGQGNGHVYLAEPSGRHRLNLQETITDDAATISDVTDPQKKVQLFVKSTGAGSLGHDPVKAGGLIFGMRWIGPHV